MHDFIMLISIMEFRFVDNSCPKQSSLTSINCTMNNRLTLFIMFWMLGHSVTYSISWCIFLYREINRSNGDRIEIHIIMYNVTLAIINSTKSQNRTNHCIQIGLTDITQNYTMKCILLSLQRNHAICHLYFWYFKLYITENIK